MLNSEFNIFMERLPSVGSRALGGLGWFIFAIRQIDSEWIKTDKKRGCFESVLTQMWYCWTVLSTAKENSSFLSKINPGPITTQLKEVSFPPKDSLYIASWFSLFAIYVVASLS